MWVSRICLAWESVSLVWGENCSGRKMESTAEDFLVLLMDLSASIISAEVRAAKRIIVRAYRNIF